MMYDVFGPKPIDMPKLLATYANTYPHTPHIAYPDTVETMCILLIMIPGDNISDPRGNISDPY